MGYIGVEPIKDWLAPTHRYATGDHRDSGACGVTVLTQLLHIGGQLIDLCCVRPEKRVLFDLTLIETGAIKFDRAELGQKTMDGDTMCFAQIFFCYATGGNAHGGLSCR